MCQGFLREEKAQNDKALGELAAANQRADKFQNMLSEKFPTSFGHLKWACGHTGPAKCLQCAEKAEAALLAEKESAREQWDARNDAEKRASEYKAALAQERVRSSETMEKLNMAEAAMLEANRIIDGYKTGEIQP